MPEFLTPQGLNFAPALSSLIILLNLSIKMTYFMIQETLLKLLNVWKIN